tara:strand:+ start:1891 stop:2226 length:336 start_codon:yes stop_codon:yes gene_type:complete
MANFYKSNTFDLTTTNLTTVLSVNTSSIAIVKTVQAVHDTASNVNTDLFITKSGASAVQMAHAQINKETVNLIVDTLNLEAGDAISIQADTSNAISGVVSYLLIDRSQENG